MEDEERLALKRACDGFIGPESRSDYVVGGRLALDARIRGEEERRVSR